MALLLCGGAVVISCDKEPDVGDDNQSIPFPDAVNLSLSETSNCYVVSKDGRYQFKTVKGNSNSSVGSVATAEVLWESFGTAVTPSVGDLLKYAVYKDGYIAFQTADTFKEGNAVIAAKDAAGNILWSWHIWLTDQPEGQVYYYGAGTMMDRNLGATSATPGDVGALGLLYQWGRKDPFLGSSSISESIKAKSTITWPSTIQSSSSVGTIEYTVAHPTTFITANDNNYDWHYTGDKTRWTTSDKAKSIYDPCPAGWRVPDGGDKGVWAKAYGGLSDFQHSPDASNCGMNFMDIFGSSKIIWYPASGERSSDIDILTRVGSEGSHWSASPSGSDSAYHFRFAYGYGLPSCGSSHAWGYSVRCYKEGSSSDATTSEDDKPSVPFPAAAEDISSSETSNCYIVSKGGTYKFKTVKGNSNSSVGSVASAEVLWESFGTVVTPSVGDLLEYATYKDGYIAFKTADVFKEGNAVIAAKDATGNILWSWHIWLTDQPQEQAYYNNAGTMMDRNLGATSATPGDVGALGLLYQWGRKDPFLGSSSINNEMVEAKSTISWLLSASSESSCGTIEYAISHPTTFIKGNSSNSDWYYTGNNTTDDTRWTPSDQVKSIYDPCPAGWRVPDGGNNGVWARALGMSSGLLEITLYDSANKGTNLAAIFGSDQIIWYPASGQHDISAYLVGVGLYGGYWSVSANSSRGTGGSCLNVANSGSIYPLGVDKRAAACSVRCYKENSSFSPPSGGETMPDDSSIPFPDISDLSSNENSNCYIVSKSGTYKFKTVKGNSNSSVGSVSIAEVLWESLGAWATTSVGDLLEYVTYKDGYIAFQTADVFKEGNAVIAAKDATGNILWSWHIWLTDEPQEQVYFNNAGTMMDRNLGATSATPGDVGTLGLHYQWGRKDPFRLYGDTIVYPLTVSSSSSTGTIAYAIANPTTFITNNDKNKDWYYTGSEIIVDNTRWTTSDQPKSIYDPCPVGWRVPDGERSGVWSKASGSPSSFAGTYSSTNAGMNFSGKFGSASTIWYPASGCLVYGDGRFYGVGNIGYYWSASTDSNRANGMGFSNSGYVYPSYDYNRASGQSVRCLQE